MGQQIEIGDVTIDGAVAAFHTDRGITGQDGFDFDSAAAAEESGGFAGDLAVRLFGADEAIDHLYIASNQVVVRRVPGWDDASLATAHEIVTRFFVFYA